jgi:predicted amino acid-binding ACT domain protein
VPRVARRVQYFYATTQDKPGQAFQVLSQLAESEVNLLAFSATPTGPNHTQLVLFPENTDGFRKATQRIGLDLSAPQHAFLVQGDDELGVLADIHRRLADASVNVYTSQGVADGRGGFGYLIYVRPEEYEAAARVLEV